MTVNKVADGKVEKPILNTKTRDKRMLQVMLGTLERFKSEQENDQMVHDKRQSIEQRQRGGLQVSLQR